MSTFKIDLDCEDEALFDLYINFNPLITLKTQLYSHITLATFTSKDQDVFANNIFIDWQHWQVQPDRYIFCLCVLVWVSESEREKYTVSVRRKKSKRNHRTRWPSK